MCVMCRVYMKWLLLVVGLLVSSNDLFANTRDLLPYNDIKAAYIYRFLYFIQWDSTDTSTEMDSDTIRISVLGDDPIMESLRPLSNNLYNDRIIVIEQSDDYTELASSDIVYIASDNFSYLDSILPVLMDNHVLTIGDSEWFVEAGGMVSFVIVDTRVRFLFNLDAIHSAGIDISPRLLNLAHRVISSSE